MALFLCFLFLIVSSAAACDRCVHQSKVAYFSRASALSSGACGYGSMAIGFNSGNLAAAVSSLYKDGAGCGACFQIRCKDANLCSSRGTRVIGPGHLETGDCGEWNIKGYLVNTKTRIWLSE
ncbi:hypothetical protein OIU77_020806 [Salix suchowensis]|uniref:Expansin-like EG45 domain-containing protein n=1 Tax=Salix suchowensis TaxID=1278906 RepID=A0ABQ9CBG6_9ROSI|nr:hypothetical protein OIU77_020806 [Salix suchowensis]